MFHMFIPCGNIFSLVPRSKSRVNVKVKCQDHIFQGMAFTGALVFHKHSFFDLEL